MNTPANHRLLAVSLLSTTVLTGCVVWKSDYDALQAQNQQLQAQLAASQQQVSRLVGAVKYVANSDLLFASGSWQMRPQGRRVRRRPTREYSQQQPLWPHRMPPRFEFACHQQ